LKPPFRRFVKNLHETSPFEDGRGRVMLNPDFY
jgi:hypothetical protein